MDLHLAGRIAIVTGASKGIGLAITRALVGEGATVVAGARSAGADLSALQAGGRVSFVPVDLAGPEGPTALVDRAVELGGLDVLVNNVGGVTPRPDGFASVTDDDWFRTITLTLMAAVRTTRAALPVMADRGGGSVITISSVNAYLPDPLVIDYSPRRLRWPTSANRCRKRLRGRGFGSIRSAPDPSRQICGSAIRASPARLPKPPVSTRQRSPLSRQPAQPPVGSPGRPRSPLWCCS